MIKNFSKLSRTIVLISLVALGGVMTGAAKAEAKPIHVTAPL